MGWQTNDPGGSYSSVASITKAMNKYTVVITVSMARLTNNGIAFKFVQTTSKGSSSTYKPPDYMDFRVGSDTRSENWGTGGGERYYVKNLTLYWRGTLNKNSTVNVKVGAHDAGDSAFDHAVYINKDVTGPDYTSKYSLTFNGNGNNSGSTSSFNDKTYGTEIIMPECGYTKTGYNFVGWNTNQSATTAQYQPGDSYTITANVTFYAIWSQITYTVSYNGNGADSGTTEEQTKYWGTPLTLQSNGYTKANYTFQHWNTAADDSGTSYAAGASYIDNAAVTLYAIWKKNNIPVFIRSGNAIIQVEKAFINVGGTIKECTVYQNLGGNIIVYQ